MTRDREQTSNPMGYIFKSNSTNVQRRKWRQWKTGSVGRTFSARLSAKGPLTAQKGAVARTGGLRKMFEKDG